MTTIAEIKEAAAAVVAAEDERCPPEFEDGTHTSYGPKGKRSEWYEAHWKREEAAKMKLDAMLSEELARRGVRIKTDGCGCCDSPALTVCLDDQYVASRGNWYFDNLPQTKVGEAEAAPDRLGGDV